MLIKLYTFDKELALTEAMTKEAAEALQASINERLHIIDGIEDIVIHQGNYDVPRNPSEWIVGKDGPEQPIWGPKPWNPMHDEYASGGEICRVIDFQKDGAWQRIAIKLLAYVCNDLGKTIEKVEPYSGARLSK